jgi:lipoprotein-anchoring transpeptidase ErfK/SrfK
MRSAAGRAAENSLQSRAPGMGSRAALYVGITTLLMTGACPAQAQFGFSWFGGPPQPVIRMAPETEPRVRARRPEPHVRPGIGELEARRRARAGYEREAAKKDPSKPTIVGPLIIVVSVNRQHLTVYDGDRAIASSPVSTGKEGHETPLGVFSVIQKEILHHSNLYDDAPMPYMQRITWSGVALHSGPLPGHAASHGCIRLPREFAVRLWGMTKIGARVIVARNALTPVEFSDPRLFTMRQDTPDTPTASAPTAEHGATLDPSRIAPDAATDRTRAAGQLASLAAIPLPATDDAASPSIGEPEVVAAAPAKVAAADVPLPSAYAEMAPTPEEIAQAAVAERQNSATAALAPSPDPGQSAGAAASSPEAAPAAAASLDPNSQPASDTQPGSEPAPVVKVAKPKKAGPISVFVSRKEKKLFVRRGFEPVFDAPIAFEGDEPLGTHIYTAINTLAEGRTLRWVELSIASSDVPAESQIRHASARAELGRRAPQAPIPVAPTGTSASQALERVQVTPELRDRIADMIVPGSSLIISDKGLGSETGRGTDFIVLTH